MSNQQIIKGPCRLTGSAIGNIVLETKGDVIITKKRDIFDVKTDQGGTLDKRLKSVVHEIKLTPSGTWIEAGALCVPYQTKKNGQKVLNNVTVGFTVAATASGGTRTTFTHSTATVYVGQLITISGSNVAGYNGTWEVTAVADNTHFTAAVAFISTATGSVNIPPCLIIHPVASFSNEDHISVYQNVGITGLPDLICSSVETFLGDLTLSAICHPYLTPEDAGAIVNHLDWGAPSGALASYSDGTAILTTPPRLRFAAHDDDAFTGSDPEPAPWNDFGTQSGVKVSFNITLEPDETDQKGIVNWTFGGLEATATFTPVGDTIDDYAIQLLLEEQNSGSEEGLQRGQSLSTIVERELYILIASPGGNLSVILRNAVLTNAVNGFGTKAPRGGEMTVMAVRRVVAGVLQSLVSISD